MDAPLLARLLAAHAAETAGFHMPGHGAGAAWPPELAARLASLDSTELEDTDDLNAPGPALEAARAAAAAHWGAARSWLLAGGSSLGIAAALLAAAGRGGAIAVERTAHQASLRAAMLAGYRVSVLAQPSDAEPDWQRPLPGAVTPQVLTQALEADPALRTVLITSPDYYGRYTPLAELAACCRRHGATLIVDAAHAAHYASLPALASASALAEGADLVVQSAHKTLPALTGAAYLHLGTARRVAEARVDEALRLLQGSSPSLLIAASADYARAWVAANGAAEAQRLTAAWRGLREQMRGSQAGGLGPLRLSTVDGGGRDPLRWLIGCTRHGASARLARALADEGLVVEFHDHRRLILIPPLATPTTAVEALGRALLALAPGLVEGPLTAEEARLSNVDAQWQALCRQGADFAYQPHEILSMRQEPAHCALEEGTGRIAAAAVQPYPPGIPLIWPGERIQAGQLELLRALRDEGLGVQGLEAGLAVLAQPP